MLRTAFNRFFSKASVAKMDHIIRDAAAKLCQKIEDRRREDGPLNIVMAYSCFTTEVICQYCYGKSAGYLDRDGFQETLRPAISGAARSGPFIKQWPFLFTMLDSLPDRIVGALMPDMAAFLRFASDMQEQVAAIVAGKGEYEKRAETCPTIFHELLDSDRPEEEKQPWRLGQEGTVLLAAGTEVSTRTVDSMSEAHVADNIVCGRRPPGHCRPSPSTCLTSLHWRDDWRTSYRMPVLTHTSCLRKRSSSSCRSFVQRYRKV